MGNKITLVLLSVLVATFALLGCGGGGGGGTNPVATDVSGAAIGSLAGTVRYNGQILSDASVFLYKYDTAHLAGFAATSSIRGSIMAQALKASTGYVTETTTNSEGYYEISNIPVGQYTIIAAKGNLQFSQEVQIQAALTPVDAVLTPTGTITGTVQSTKNSVTSPAVGVMVYLDGNSYVAFTDADGVFTITNVPTNRSFVLKVMPGISGFASTSPTVTALAGQTVNAGTITLSVPVEQTGSISGAVVMTAVRAPDARLAGTIVMLTGPEKYFSITDENGAYGFIVKTAGAYSVNAVHADYAVSPSSQAITVALNGSTTVPEFTIAERPVPTQTWVVSGYTVNTLNSTDIDGVPLTLSNMDDPSVMPVTVISGSDGSFAFNVPAGSYALTIGKTFVFDPFATYRLVSVTSADISLGNLGVKPNITPKFDLAGIIDKAAFAYADNDQGGVILTLTPEDASPSMTAVSGVDGSFGFRVPVGTYTLIAGGFYELATPSLVAAISVTGNTPLGTVVVKPNQKVGGVISGTITSDVAVPHQVKLEDQSAMNYTDFEMTSSNGFYSFDDIPPGDYKVVVLPTASGYFVESAVITVSAGNQTSVNLSAVKVAPFINGTPDPDLGTPNRLEVNGTGFDVGQTVFVDGFAAPRYSGYTATNITDQVDVSAIAPGNHSLIIEKNWLRASTSEIFTLRSQPFVFTRTLGVPTAVTASEITDNSALITWKNAPYCNQAEITTDPPIVGIPVIEGNSFRLTGLAAATTYTVTVKNKLNTMVSGGETVSFGTKATSINSMADLALSSIPSSGANVFGFEVENDGIYVAYAQSGSIYVAHYTLDGSPGNWSSFANDSVEANLELFSMAVSSTHIYLTYSAAGVPKVCRIDKAFSGQIVKDLATDFSLSGVNAAKVRVHGDKVFLSASSDNALPYLAYANLTELAADLSANTPVVSEIIPTSLSGHGVMTCTDDVAQNLYVAVASGSSMVSSVDVYKYDLTDLSLLGSVGKFSANGSIADFKFASGKVFFKENYNGVSAYYRSMNVANGYVTSLSSSGNEVLGLDVDGSGRMWLAEKTPSGNFYVQGEKSLNVYDFPSLGNNVSWASEYLEYNPSDGHFYMAYFSPGMSYLSVYKYDSDM